MDSKKIIVGIDEVGRGCLAGPLVAAAVILEKPIDGVIDSKLISKSNREKLASIIKNDSLAYGIGWTEIDDINKHGLTYAVSHAMQMALSKIDHSYDEVIIDGNYNYLPHTTNVTIIIKADLICPSVSAASIIAKVYRDEWMAKLAEKYPQYGFEKHVGYGTKNHLEMLDKFGPTDQHRMFYRPLLKFAT